MAFLYLVAINLLLDFTNSDETSNKDPTVFSTHLDAYLHDSKQSMRRSRRFYKAARKST